jgi:hypothetical protein
MTIKEALSKKIQELEEEKLKLIKKAAFLDPDNDMFVYHTMQLSKISGTTGSTPSNLSEILTKIVEEINKYAEYINSIPNKETSVLKRDRGVEKYAIFSTKGLIPAPVTWKEISTDLTFSSVQQYLPMSKYRGFAKKIKIKSSTAFRKGGIDYADIDYDIVLYRINLRKNIIEEYFANGSYVDVTIDNDHLYGDDFFIIGFKPKLPLIKTSIYYSNLSYSIDIEGEDGSMLSKTYTIGNTKVGNIIPNADCSEGNMVVYWSMFSLNEFNINCTDVSGNVTQLLPDVNTDLASSYDGNKIITLSSDGIAMDVSRYNISYRKGISNRFVVIDDRYRLYDMMDNGISSIIIKNVIPIDVIIERAIHEL